jgi:hypothetical protein
MLFRKEHKGLIYDPEAHNITGMDELEGNDDEH